MKAFLLAIALIAIITGLAVFDFIYSKSNIDKLDSYLYSTPEKILDDEIPNDLVEQVHKIDSLWNKYKKYLCATINYQQITTVSIAVTDFKNAVLEQGGSHEYAKARDTLITSFKNLRRFTTTSLESIF